MKKFILATIISISFFLVAIITINDYGLSIDASFHLLRGQAYAQFFLTGKKTFNLPDLSSPILIRPNEYVSRYYYSANEGTATMVTSAKNSQPQKEYQNFIKKTGKRISFYQNEAWNGQYFIQNDFGHPPLMDILSAFSNRFFYQTLGILGDIQSYQLAFIAISSLGIFITCLFTFDVTNSYLAELVAGLSLALFPYFIGASHINIKDPEQAVFFLGAVWAFWHYVRDNRLKWFAFSVFFTALAMAVKWNIVIAPFAFIVWLITIRKTDAFKKWFHLKKFIILSILAAVATFSFIAFIWPYTWNDPLNKLINIFIYYKNTALTVTKTQPAGFMTIFGFNLYPLIFFLVKTPLIFVLLSLAAVVLCRVKKDKLRTTTLLLILIILPIVRLSLPGTSFYSSFRQFLEVAPFLAVLCGIGIWRLENLTGKVYKKIFMTIIILAFIFLAFRLVKLHPNEDLYFNFLSNVKPLEKNQLLDWESTENLYKQAALWIDFHAEKNAKLAQLDGFMFALSPLWLRSDISISAGNFSGLNHQGEYIIAPYSPENPPVFAYRYPTLFLKPIHRIAVNGVSLLTIYKNDSGHLKNGYRNEIKTTDFQIKQVVNNNGDYWSIDLGQQRLVTRVVVSGPAPICLRKFYELTGFVSENKTGQPIDENNLYVLNERKNLGEGMIEYSFPAVPARQILFFPQSQISCIAAGKILSISYLAR